MKHLRIKIIGLTLLLSILSSAGCNRSTPPPTPLSVEELQAAFNKVFGKANPETKSLANQIVADVQAKDYSKAFLALQSLLTQATLSKQQMGVASGALLTVNELLAAAQTEGDTKAAETIKVYRSAK